MRRLCAFALVETSTPIKDCDRETMHKSSRNSKQIGWAISDASGGGSQLSSPSSSGPPAPSAAALRRPRIMLAVVALGLLQSDGATLGGDLHSAAGVAPVLDCNRQLICARCSTPLGCPEGSQAAGLIQATHPASAGHDSTSDLWSIFNDGSAGLAIFSGRSFHALPVDIVL